MIHELMATTIQGLVLWEAQEQVLIYVSPRVHKADILPMLVLTGTMASRADQALGDGQRTLRALEAHGISLSVHIG